jgi:hypothetical protein
VTTECQSRRYLNNGRRKKKRNQVKKMIQIPLQQKKLLLKLQVMGLHKEKKLKLSKRNHHKPRKRKSMISESIRIEFVQLMNTKSLAIDSCMTLILMVLTLDMKEL